MRLEGLFVSLLSMKISLRWEHHASMEETSLECVLSIFPWLSFNQRENVRRIGMWNYLFQPRSIDICFLQSNIGHTSQHLIQQCNLEGFPHCYNSIMVSLNWQLNRDLGSVGIFVHILNISSQSTISYSVAQSIEIVFCIISTYNARIGHKLHHHFI